MYPEAEQSEAWTSGGVDKGRESEISNRLTALAETQESVNNAISELEKRLISVLRVEGEGEPGRTQGVPREAYSTTLAQTIDLAVIAGQNSYVRISEIMRRLEL
jgi:hypothetical protein